MKTPFNSIDDFQILRFALTSKHNDAFIMTSTEFLDKPDLKLSIEDLCRDIGNKVFLPTYGYVNSDKFYYNVLPVYDGCIEIRPTAMLLGYNYIPELTKKMLENVLKRTIEQLEELKLEEDTEFWPLFKHPVFTSEIQRDRIVYFASLMRDHLNRSTYYKIDLGFIKQHPLTLRKIEDLLKRVKDLKNVQRTEADPFIIEQRKLLFKEVNEEFLVTSRAVLQRISEESPALFDQRNFVQNFLSTLDHVKRDFWKRVKSDICFSLTGYSDGLTDGKIDKDKIAALINSSYNVLRENMKQTFYQSDSIEIKMKFIDQIFNEEGWSRTIDLLNMLIADEGLPDIPYYFAAKGLIDFE